MQNARELGIVRVEAVNRVKSGKNYEDVKFHRAILTNCNCKYKGSRPTALKGFRVFGTTELRNDIRKLMVL